MNIPWADNDSDLWKNSFPELCALHEKWTALAAEIAFNDPALTSHIGEMGGKEAFYAHLSRHLEIFIGVPNDEWIQKKSQGVGYAHIEHHVPPSAYVTLYNAIFTAYHDLPEDDRQHLPPMLTIRMRWLRDMATVLDTYMATMDQTMAELHSLATTDALTSLLNRRGLMDHIQISEHQPCTFILFDIDSFKDVNDYRGHPAGDMLLQDVALYLMTNARENHLVARLGGDEFLWWWPDEVTNATLYEELNGLQEMLVTQHHITASFGVAMAPPHGHSFDALYKAADDALYRAKRRAPKDTRTRDHAIIGLD